MSKVKRNSLIVLLLTAGILTYILTKNLPGTIGYIKQTNIPLFIVAILLFVISWGFDSLSYFFIIRQYKKDYKMGKAFKINLLTKFFNGITPLASGGQPLQIYCLHKDKVKLHDATTIVFQFYIIYQVALILLSTGCIVYTKINQNFIINPFVKHMLIIGFVANFLILSVLLLVSFNKKFNKKIVRFCIKILTKLHIVKDKEATIKEWDTNCDNFFESAQLMKKNKGIFLLGVFLQFIQLLFQYAIPIVLVKAVGCENTLNLVQTIVASSYVFLIGCFIPIPGATGGMEYAFSRCFGQFIIEDSIQAVIILWRMITYILPVVAGGILFNIKSKDDQQLKEIK